MPVNTNLMREVAYEPELIIKSNNYPNFEFIRDASGWIFGTDAINSFYVYRMPIVKTASISLVTFAVDPEIFGAIDNDLQNGMFPDIRIKFNLADLSKPINNKSYTKLPAGITYTGKVIHMFPRTSMTSQTKIVPVSLYIVHVVPFYLNLGNSYNKILNNVTAMQALQSFEGAMTDRFGASTLGFNHRIGSQINTHKYENILIKSANDLTVPSIIQTTYKPLNQYSFFFFDDFDSAPGSASCVGRFHDLSSHTPYEAWHIFEDDTLYDIPRTIRSKGKVHIADRHEGFRPNFNEASTFVKDSTSKIQYKKNNNKLPIEQTVNNSQQGYIYDRVGARQTENKNSQLIKKNKDNYRHLSYYTPDTLAAAKTRNDNYYIFLKNLTNAVYKFEIFQSHLDAIQFYRKYTFDQTDLRSYYVPINIINIFSKVNPHETRVSHTAQFQTIKYPSF